MVKHQLGNTHTTCIVQIPFYRAVRPEMALKGGTPPYRGGVPPPIAERVQKDLILFAKIV